MLPNMFSHFIPGISGPITGGSYTSGPKGFTVPAELWAEREASMEWAVAYKPGATPILGGRNRRIRERAARIRATVYSQVAGPNGRRAAERLCYGRHTPKGILALPKPSADA